MRWGSTLSKILGNYKTKCFCHSDATWPVGNEGSYFCIPFLPLLASLAGLSIKSMERDGKWWMWHAIFIRYSTPMQHKLHHKYVITLCRMFVFQIFIGGRILWLASIMLVCCVGTYIYIDPPPPAIQAYWPWQAGTLCINCIFYLD